MDNVKVVVYKLQIFTYIWIYVHMTEQANINRIKSNSASKTPPPHDPDARKHQPGHIATGDRASKNRNNYPVFWFWHMGDSFHSEALVRKENRLSPHFYKIHHLPITPNTSHHTSLYTLHLVYTPPLHTLSIPSLYQSPHPLSSTLLISTQQSINIVLIISFHLYPYSNTLNLIKH